MKTQLWLALGAGALLGLSASAQTPPEVTLTRIDCGTSAKPMDLGRFSDIYAYPNQSKTFVFSCYLIKHGNEYMVWDTGFAPGSNLNAPKERFKKIADTLKATVIIQHDQRDIDKLPAWPNAAK